METIETCFLDFKSGLASAVWEENQEDLNLWLRMIQMVQRRVVDTNCIERSKVLLQSDMEKRLMSNFYYKIRERRRLLFF